MSDMAFKTEVEIDYLGKTGKAFIDWEVEFECRSWGIKDISVSVPAQSINVELTSFDYDATDDNEIEKTEEVTLSISTYGVSPDKGMISPKTISFDEKKNEWNLELA